MSRLSRDTTAAVVDGILRFVAAGGFVTTFLIAPNAVQILDKPLTKAFDKLDERSRARELRRIMHYMKQKGLIKYNPRDYEHGVELTRAGKERLKKKSFSSMSIPTPVKWDRKWRLVFFDIPIEDNPKRYFLTSKLRLLGFQQLQKSIWIHPFSCRAEIEAITEVLSVRKYVTYVEISAIDGEKELRTRFRLLLKKAGV